MPSVGNDEQSEDGLDLGSQRGEDEDQRSSEDQQIAPLQSPKSSDAPILTSEAAGVGIKSVQLNQKIGTAGMSNSKFT